MARTDDDANPYAAPFSEIGPPGEGRGGDRATPEVIRAVRAGAIQQATIWVIAALMLDGGRLLRLAAIAAAAYWVLTAWIVATRRSRPTRLDLVAVRHGPWIGLVLVALVVATLRRWG